MRVPRMIMCLLFALTILVDWYIYSDIRSRKWKRIYLCSSVALLAFLGVVLLLPRRGDADILPVMWMLYGYLSILLPKILYALTSLIGRLPQIFRKHRVRLGTYVGLPLGVIVFATMWYGALVGRSGIEVTHVDIVSPKLPEAFDDYKIVQISDLHLGTWGTDTTFVSRLVDSVNVCRPDLILFTGDIVNRQSSELEPFVKILSRLKAPDGVYSVLGNHDYGDYRGWNTPEDKAADLQHLKDMQAAMGWKMLNNSYDFLRAGNDSIALIGVENWGEPPYSVHGDLKKAYPEVPEEYRGLKDANFKILLSHNPEHWTRVVKDESNIDLTLAGHTHAMQLILSLGKHRWSPAQYKYKCWGGLYRNEDAKEGAAPQYIYVNIGCGEVGMPYRIGATPEITLFTLKSAAKK